MPRLVSSVLDTLTSNLPLDVPLYMFDQVVCQPGRKRLTSPIILTVAVVVCVASLNQALFPIKGNLNIHPSTVKHAHKRKCPRRQASDIWNYVMGRARDSVQLLADRVLLSRLTGTCCTVQLFEIVGLSDYLCNPTTLNSRIVQVAVQSDYFKQSDS